MSTRRARRRPRALDIDALCFSRAIDRGLREGGVETIRDLCASRPRDLMKLPHVGPAVVETIRSVLQMYGLDLVMEDS
ncbi:DNA-directed RNA polymerase subunit alpha C-terminal domain-containing protein [Paraburkholderia adhaesiva]|uniref:DNA-directed RNA polymerase subunit alpha C-terminal domain-containing protein n=1 Tax=Paraburkholderia adhaesiva TaxID=2883244 RepID=UPI001F287AE8|nr:DNA-directed RNA polymerase subunit alpha C-terminal domain-containing protein [Paraburkholderia adhaesiva]